MENTRAIRCFCLLAATLTLGCSSTLKISSKVNDEAQIGKIAKMFIYLRTPDDINMYMDPMRAKMTELLLKNGNLVKVIKEDPLALSNASFIEEVRSFSPDAVLVFSTVEKSVSSYSDIEFDALILDPDLKTRIWRANIKSSVYVTATGVATPWDFYGEKLAREVLRKMDEDSIIVLKSKITGPASSKPNN